MKLQVTEISELDDLWLYQENNQVGACTNEETLRKRIWMEKLWWAHTFLTSEEQMTAWKWKQLPHPPTLPPQTYTHKRRKCTHIQTYAGKWTHKHSQTNTHTHKHTQTNTHTWKNIRRQTQKQTYTYTRKLKHANILKYTNTNKHTHTCIGSKNLTLLNRTFSIFIKLESFNFFSLKKKKNKYF